jgi:hypothetical protein
MRQRSLPSSCVAATSQCPGPPEDQQLDFAKGELDVSLALLDKDEAGRVVIEAGMDRLQLAGSAPYGAQSSTLTPRSRSRE